MPMYPSAGKENTLVLNHSFRPRLPYPRFGLPEILMRWPSPPPIRSTPVVVENVIAAGAPLASVVVHETFQ